MPRRAPSEKNTPDGVRPLGNGFPFLREVRRRGRESSDRFPFSVPVVRDLTTLAFPTPVTFFVGENGSGKSTLLEGIAAAAGLPTAGSAEANADATLDAQRLLGNALNLVWTRRTHRGLPPPENCLGSLRCPSPTHQV